MTQPRRKDEIELYALLRAISHPSTNVEGNRLVHRSELIAASEQLAIPAGRAGYILDKWERKSWWHTHSAAGGWFTPSSPLILLPHSTIDQGPTT